MNLNILNVLKLSFNVLKPRILTPITQYSTKIIETTPTIQNNNDYEVDKLYSSIELEMRGHDPAVLKSYAWYLATAAGHLGIEVKKNYALRKSEKERHTLLKSVHVYKKHRVQYEIRTYFRFIHLHHVTGSTADTYLEYIERNLPEGVSLKVTKIEIQPLPIQLQKPPT